MRTKVRAIVGLCIFTLYEYEFNRTLNIVMYFEECNEGKCFLLIYSS